MGFIMKAGSASQITEFDKWMFRDFGRHPKSRYGTRHNGAMFDRGEPVLYRELWGDAVMTAMPLRVVADRPERTVLYLAADTAFRGARAPDGGPVRDLDEWVSMDVVWAGGSLIRLLEPGAWHCVDVEFAADRRFTGWYVNFQEPMRRTRAGFDTVDLVLDLVVDPDGGCRRKDEEDFAKAVADGHVTAQVADQVLADADRMTRAATAGTAPFDERHWLTWQPPPQWTVPRLDDQPHPSPRP